MRSLIVPILNIYLGRGVSPLRLAQKVNTYDLVLRFCSVSSSDDFTFSLLLCSARVVLEAFFNI